MRWFHEHRPVGCTRLVPGAQVWQLVRSAKLLVKPNGADRTDDVGLPVGRVLPDCVERLLVARLAGQRRDVRERYVKVGRTDGVTDGFPLPDDRQMILCVGAIDGVLTLPRIVVPAALVEEELRQLPVTLVARVPIEVDQADLQPLVTGDVGLLAGPVSGLHCGGRLNRRIEQSTVARRFVPGNCGLEKVARRADHALVAGEPTLDARHRPLDEGVDLSFQLGIAAFGQHVCRRLDHPRAVEPARLLVLPENVLNRYRPVRFDLRRPEGVGDVHLGLRHRDDRIVSRGGRESPHRQRGRRAGEELRGLSWPRLFA